MSEWASAGRLLGRGLGSITDTVAAMHDTIAQRVEARLPPGAAHVAATHRVAAAGVYRTVGAGHRAIPAAIGTLAPDRPLGGRAALPVLNGLWGDAFTDEPLAIQMSLRDHTPQGGRLIVFVHGLFEDDTVWDPSLQLPGRTALYVRYNTGLHISENGRLLSELLERTVAQWPEPPESIALVGHSMGGLVARSAAAQAQGSAWLPLLTHVVTLASPHLGSPVEKAVHVADWLLRVAPQSRPLGELVARRSAGIKDLRYGAILEQDWHGHDPDEFLRDRCTEVPFTDGVTYCWVAAVVRDNRIGQWLGDGLVREASASGRGRGMSMHHGVTVRGNHLNVLTHEHVHAHLADWLT